MIITKNFVFFIHLLRTVQPTQLVRRKQERSTIDIFLNSSPTQFVRIKKQEKSRINVFLNSSTTEFIRRKQKRSRIDIFRNSSPTQFFEEGSRKLIYI